MNLAGKPVLFRLSVGGHQALSSVFPSGGLFMARVVEQDELGLWITLQEGEGATQMSSSVMLLKWEYLSTAVLNLEPEQPVARRRIGF